MNIKPHILLFALLLAAVGAAAQVRQPFTALSNNADTANKKLYVEVMYEKPGCGDYMAMFTLVDRTGISTPLEIDSVLNNAGTYQLSTDRRALMRPTAGGYRLRFNLLDGASVHDGYRVVVNTYKLAYRCVGCGAAGSDAIFEPKHVKAGCPPIEGEVLACHQRTGRMANWEAWVQDPRDCQPYRVVMLPDGKWWFSQNLRWSDLGQRTADGSSLYTWYEAILGKESPDSTQLLVNINSDETGPQGVCPTGWHVPTEREWHSLGTSMGSGAAILTDRWQPRALHHLASFSWYNPVERRLREGNDESGFTWMPTPFAGVQGINGGSVKHGALWSAGAMSDSPGDTTINRVAAQATATAWSANPLTADNRAGSRLRDMLPVRCAYGMGIAPTVVAVAPPNDEEQTCTDSLTSAGVVTICYNISAAGAITTCYDVSSAGTITTCYDMSSAGAISTCYNMSSAGTISTCYDIASAGTISSCYNMASAGAISTCYSMSSAGAISL